MKITNLNIKNYRTLEKLNLQFPSFYTAICGKNDSGKTNIVRALRGIMKEDDPYTYRDEQDVSIKHDFTKWIEAEIKNRKITITIDLGVNKNADAGLYQFLITHLSLVIDDEDLTIHTQVDYGGEEAEEEVTLTVKDQQYTGLKAQEVLKKLQSSRTVLFYNSTEFDPRFRYGRGFGGFFRELSSEYSEEIDSIKQTISKKLKQITKGHQKQLTDLLGRLEEKYKVSLSVPSLDLGFLPYNITLSHGKVDVALNDWGSGTRNRTLILLTLFRAHEISQSSVSASKVTPIIVIEEPESFLHPSAQAEFGRILQDLSEEFKVQVIATTHSPYMLSQENSSSNVLLERKVSYNQLRETSRVETSGSRWMEPFGLALGIDSKELEPWKAIFFSKSPSILFVEGEIDKSYFELLRQPEHGTKQLKFDGEIFPYCGRDNLKQSVLLKFFKDRYKTFITFDLDAESEIEKSLTALGFEKNKHYCALGINQPGKRDIEGLLPDIVKTAVHTANPALVEQARNGTTQERKDANSKLKWLFLQEFTSKATSGQDFYGKFYEAVKLINKALD